MKNTAMNSEWRCVSAETIYKEFIPKVPRHACGNRNPNVARVHYCHEIGNAKRVLRDEVRENYEIIQAIYENELADLFSDISPDMYSEHRCISDGVGIPLYDFVEDCVYYEFRSGNMTIVFARGEMPIGERYLDDMELNCGGMRIEDYVNLVCEIASKIAE